MLVTLRGPRPEGRTPGGLSREQRGRIPPAAQTAGEEPQDTGVSGLPAHMASLWPAFYPPLAPGPHQQGWSQSVCLSACIDLGAAGIQVLGCLCCIRPKATNTQAITQQREAHEASKTWGTFVVFKNFPGLLK